VILRALGRLILVPLAFAIATVVAVLVLATLGLERVTHALGQGLEGDGVDILFEIGRGAIGLAGAATIVPAIVVVIVGEVARIRSALYYVVGGGIALAALPLLAPNGPGGSAAGVLGAIWPVLATAGFAGGLAYWLIAGRNA
jgi:hypothetical protein